MQFNHFTRGAITFQIVSFVLICGLFSSSAQARLVGKINQVRPVVELRMGKTGPWKKATNGSHIEPGQTIRCGAKGSAELRFTNGTVVVLKPKAQVFIEGKGTVAKPLALRIVSSPSQIIVRSKGMMPIIAEAAKSAPESKSDFK